jgi:NitT/TauT family transport system substrate-binding protein
MATRPGEELKSPERFQKSENQAEKTMKYLIRSTIAAAGVLAAFSVAPAVAQAKLTFLLNVPPAGYNAGFELAVEKALYKAAGLDVTIEPGNGSQTTAQLIAVGKYDIGFADSAPVMKLISEGAKVRVLATILQGNPNAVTALKKTGLKSVADMKGKSVAMPNAGSQSSMFPLVLAANGLKESDIKLVNMPPQSMVASLIQGSVEVILGSVDQYDIQLKAQGQEFDSYLFIDSGAPTVSTSIIASDDFLAKNPDVAKKFVAASLKGWYATLDNPTEAVAAMKKMFPDANEKLAPAQIEATRFLMCVNRARFVGKATPEQWADTVKIFNKIGVLPENVPATRYYTYDYLPAESELRSCPLK